MRAALNRAHTTYTEATTKLDEANAIADNLRNRQQEILEKHLPENERFIAALAGPTDQQLEAMPEADSALYTTLAGKLDYQHERIQKFDNQVKVAASKVREAEDDFRATPDGIGEAMRDVEQLAAAATTAESERKRQLAVRQGLKRIHDAEHRMAQEGFDRRDRWGTTDAVPAARAAEIGARTGDSNGFSRASFIVQETQMHGSYSNSFTPDPDGMETANSPGSGDHAIRHSRVEVVRGDTNARVTIPMHRSSGYYDTTGPSVRQTIESAVQRAEGYNADYATWARENGYHATDQGWAGSASYALGRKAHKESKAVSDRIRRFLDPHEYDAIAKELHANP